jgi:hypothetical protein
MGKSILVTLKFRKRSILISRPVLGEEFKRMFAKVSAVALVD